ncbi:MAG: hypothetical protein K0R14_1451 [Burkholderiales bacterium]|jgi:uncharacterized protein YdiU (UPF0061 family)|nr:hypothetical protein [Burkholderiales bacterium]
MFNISPQFAFLGPGFYQLVTPTPLLNPHLIHLNKPLTKQLNLDDVPDTRWLNILNGTPVETYKPLASIYAGHQFGTFVPQLGDGRAILIAEHKDTNNQVWELQLKGSGQTPYSRFGDGRAVLRSSIREYLCSHAMAALGIPTTLAIAMIDSDTKVAREEIETGSIILRAAPSFIRFGHFEVFASRNQINELSKLANFVIDHYYPECNNAPNKFSALLDRVADNTAKMIAKWQGVGFCHGVMNSDNMSILGLTLDYGPFGFLDNYNPRHIFNHSDHEGRYSYANQPQIAGWNLERLAECLSLLTKPEELQNSLNNYAKYFNQYYIQEMGNKLGIINFGLEDLDLLSELLNILASSNTDWTIFWHNLSKITRGNRASILDYVSNRDELKSWLDKYLIRRTEQDLDFAKSKTVMLNTNPALVLRGHLAQNSISRAQAGDYADLERLFNALSTPFEMHDAYLDYYGYPPEWASHSNLSCSS